MQTHPSPRFYLPELDGLRFVAFLLVFIHNASPILKGTFLERFSEYSWFGVDLFFCLSGYLITKSIETDLAKVRSDWSQDVDALRAEDDSLEELLDSSAPTHEPVHDRLRSLHRLLDTLVDDAVQGAGYVAEIGRILGM